MKLNKAFLFCPIFLFCIVQSNAQVVEDKAYMVCKYATTTVRDTLNRQKIANRLNIVDEVVVLEIGKVSSYFYSINHQNYEKNTADFRKNHLGEKISPGDAMNAIMTMGTPLKIHKNYNTNKTTTIDKIARDYYTFEVETPTFNWAIHADTMKILNQICQKATCQFKGRSYEAWFAQEINVSEGPWKFNGLPGLILKIKDSRNDYVFEAIEIKKVDSEIVAGNSIAQKVSKEKFLSIYKYYLIDPMMGVNIKDINPNMPKEFYEKLGKAKLPYNPIELTEK
jgi:GLPGLI family protein